MPARFVRADGGKDHRGCGEGRVGDDPLDSELFIAEAGGSLRGGCLARTRVAGRWGWRGVSLELCGEEGVRFGRGCPYFVCQAARASWGWS